MIRRAIVLLSAIACAQPLSSLFEIKLPRGIDSKSIYIRYVLDDQFGGWVQTRAGVSSYFIRTGTKKGSASRIRALIYSPGCAPRTLDARGGSYTFSCEPIHSVELSGRAVPPDSIPAARLHATFSARWGLSEVTEIPMADTILAADGTFHLTLPDFAGEAIAARSGFRIVAREATMGKIIAELVPTAEGLRARMGELVVRSAYPDEVAFAPCSADGWKVHDTFGFAERFRSGSVCGQ